MQITYFEYVAKHVDVFAPIATSENVVIRNLIKEIYFALLKKLRILYVNGNKSRLYNDTATKCMHLKCLDYEEYKPIALSFIFKF